MVTVVGEYTAAELAANINIFDLAPFSDYATAKFKRKVRKVTLVGGAGVADLVCDLQYGSRKIGLNLANNDITLNELQTKNAIPICSLDSCYPDEPIMLIVTDAGNTNPYTVKVEIV